MAIFPALQPAIDRGMLLALLQQDALVEATAALGAHRWDVDMPAGTLTFTSEQDPSRSLVTKTTLIASIAPGPRSMLWAWAHPQGDPEGPSAALRAAGERDGVAELAQGEVALPAGVETPDGIAALAHEIGQAATGILGRGPYYSAPIDGGTRFVFLLDAPLPPLTVATTVTKLPRMVSTGLLRDARTSLWALANTQGWAFEWGDPTFHSATVSDGASRVTVTFDDAGRVTGAQGTAAG